ncbi:MAG: ribosome biogenesis GTPase Der [Alphaproteobacteria bacterium]|nr:ribosome biogenesis GTPase Der [Alphaproteobacteria bacterium]
MTKTLLIIGRPNVGKSSLFNCLLGAKKAIVHNRRGVTRDLRMCDVQWGELRFTVIDTAGLEESLDQAHPDAEDVRARVIIEHALRRADQVLLIIDAQKGVTTGDTEIAGWLRRFGRPTQVVLNKAEGKIGDSATEAFRLGFGAPALISATHNMGVAEMMSQLAPNFKPERAKNTEVTAAEDIPLDEAAVSDPLLALRRPLRLAILGRPNVGKSSIINHLLGFDRQVTGNIAGLTRDAIEIPWRKPQDSSLGWNLVDTAGLKSHGQYRDSLDRATARETWNAIIHADVVTLVVEATAPLTRDDLAIAKDCATQGRPMILLVNKTDLCPDPQAMAHELGFTITESLAQIRHLPYLCISVPHDKGLSGIAELAEVQASRAAQRVGTGQLNRWLEDMLSHHPMPLIKGRRMRIKYITQTTILPPEFLLFTSHKAPIPEAYLRYLRNGLIDSFGFDGIPIRLNHRRSDNPYDAEKPAPQHKSKHRANSKLLPKKTQRCVSYRKPTKKILSLKQRAKRDK